MLIELGYCEMLMELGYFEMLMELRYCEMLMELGYCEMLMELRYCEMLMELGIFLTECRKTIKYKISRDGNRDVPCGWRERGTDGEV
jgi:hypothetical protein